MTLNPKPYFKNTLQADLIGAEQEGRHDEKRRAALHAAWAAQQDAAAVEQLLAGVKNGFRKRRHALDDEVRFTPPAMGAPCLGSIQAASVRAKA